MVSAVPRGARYHAGYHESSRLLPYPPGFGRTAIAQKTAEISRSLDVLGRPRKNKWCPEEKTIIISNKLLLFFNVVLVFHGCTVAGTIEIRWNGSLTDLF